ncbi:cytochrome c oxidase subunit 3 [Solimonas aquatica]|nr:cytochrome c oxidase subunit 3 [Solimonas aquatica]
MKRAAGSPARSTAFHGVEGLWVFIVADMSFFAVLFVSYLLGLGDQAELFARSRQSLDSDLGGFNTLVLLSSSWCLLKAVQAARLRPAQAAVARWIAAALALGLLFCVAKGLEYAAKIRQGITPLSNDFFMYYFALTGLHLLHVFAGLVVLTLLWRMARQGSFKDGHLLVLEGGAVYWHMVDLLWILLFPLLYLIR